MWFAASALSSKKHDTRLGASPFSCGGSRRGTSNIIFEPDLDGLACAQVAQVLTGGNAARRPNSRQPFWHLTSPTRKQHFWSVSDPFWMVSKADQKETSAVCSPIFAHRDQLEQPQLFVPTSTGLVSTIAWKPRVWTNLEGGKGGEFIK